MSLLIARRRCTWCMRPEVSDLFCDMFSLTWNCGEETSTGLTETLRQCSANRTSRWLYNKWKPRADGYKHNWSLSVQGAENKPALISTCPYRPDIANFRIQWNPSHYCGRPAYNLWEAIYKVLPADFDRLLNQCEVTRIDLAIDIAHIRPYSFLYRANHLRKQEAKFGDQGKLNSMRMGDRGSPLSILIYDRTTGFGASGTAGCATTRIEARRNRVGRLHELYNMENVFGRLEVFQAMELSGLEDDTGVNNLIRFELAREIGLQPVMQRLRRKVNRSHFRDWLDENAHCDWYEPDEIWSGYPWAISEINIPSSSEDIFKAYRRRRRKRSG
jgi:hypothetical protein